MKSDFSESTYAFSLVNEMNGIYSFNVAPIFPSLYEEGKTGGYDTEVNIQGTPFFFQFKLSNFLSRFNAKNYKVFNSSYYQFHLHASKKSKQHELLLNLESNGNPVFYVAPVFHKSNDLNTHFQNKGMVSNSIWITPKEIVVLPDEKPHSVCFNHDLSSVYLFSEPREITSKFNLRNNIPNTTNRFITYLDYFKNSYGDEKYYENTWEGLFNQMIYIIDAHSGDQSISKVKELVQGVSSEKLKCVILSRIFFGAEILVLK